VAGKPDRCGDDGNSSFRLSSYPLRSLPKSDLQLHSPLRTPKRLSRNSLVSQTIGALADMPGSTVDPGCREAQLSDLPDGVRDRSVDIAPRAGHNNQHPTRDVRQAAGDPGESAGRFRRQHRGPGPL
jgi:hypothetical protein